MTEWWISTSMMMKLRARSKARLRVREAGLASVPSVAEGIAIVMFAPPSGAADVADRKAIGQGAPRQVWNFRERPEVRWAIQPAAADGMEASMTLLKWALLFFVIS